MLSRFGFNFNLRRYITARAAFNNKRMFSQYRSQGDVLDSLVFLW